MGGSSSSRGDLSLLTPDTPAPFSAPSSALSLPFSLSLGCFPVQRAARLDSGYAQRLPGLVLGILAEWCVSVGTNQPAAFTISHKNRVGEHTPPLVEWNDDATGIRRPLWFLLVGLWLVCCG